MLSVLRIEFAVSDTFDMTVTPSQFYLIANALNGAEQNHRVLSQNIANVNTPGFKSREISFDDFIRQIQSPDANRQILDNLPVQLTQGLESRKDGNNVDIDHQLTQLKKNNLLFQTYSHLLASKMSMMREATNG